MSGSQGNMHDIILSIDLSCHRIVHRTIEIMSTVNAHKFILFTLVDSFFSGYLLYNPVAQVDMLGQVYVDTTETVSIT